jgi:hypothetical protein
MLRTVSQNPELGLFLWYDVNNGNGHEILHVEREVPPVKIGSLKTETREFLWCISDLVSAKDVGRDKGDTERTDVHNFVCRIIN